MSKLSEITLVVGELSDVISSLNDITNRLNRLFSTEDKPTIQSAEPKEQPKKQLTLEEVRAVCAEKSRAGFTAEVKAIIAKHGVDKLSAVKPEDYESILANVEVLGNA